jgi:hypothetical protein
MRRLNVICAGLASRKSWKEIAAELKTTVPAVRTCWYRYKHLIPAPDPTEQPDEPQNGHEELVDNQDIPRMTPEILKTLSAFQTEYWFSDWNPRWKCNGDCGNHERTTSVFEKQSAALSAQRRPN